jgi:tRNA threonylcarbamoyladenosine biosynthesis protein TsaB
LSTVLAVDSSSGEGSLALAREGKPCDSVRLAAEWTSTALHGELHRLLERHQLKSADLDGYAVANGPGAFTGLRVGLVAVKGLAEAHGKPVVLVSTLELLAEAAREQSSVPSSGMLAPLLDARRSQVFAALYEMRNGELARVVEECVSALPLFLERVRAACGSVRFCTTEPERFAGEIVRAGWERSAVVQVEPNLSATLARLGLRRLRQGYGVPAAQAEANYVRLSDAELFWKE